MMTLGSRPSDKYDAQNKQVQQELHDSLILDLQDKERAIEQGMLPAINCKFILNQLRLLFFSEKSVAFFVIT